MENWQKFGEFRILKFTPKNFTFYLYYDFSICTVILVVYHVFNLKHCAGSFKWNFYEIEVNNVLPFKQ